MDREDFINVLEHWGPCSGAMDWVYETEGTPRELWYKCPYDTKLEWLLDNLTVDLCPERGTGIYCECRGCKLLRTASRAAEAAWPGDDPSKETADAYRKVVPWRTIARHLRRRFPEAYK
jgi:hypothetical protein